jgi:hypothetical protein
MIQVVPSKSQGYHACFAMFTSMLVSLAASSVHAATQRYTYQFVEGQDRPLRYGGGLTGMDVFANLAGSFDLEIEDDGASAITRFDVLLMDILEQGDVVSTLKNGDLLLPLLYVNPIGLGGEYDGSNVTLGPSGLAFADPVTRITLTPNGATTALFTVRSSSNLLDGPSASTESLGILVQLVPEPTTAGLAAMMIGVALLSRGFRQRG